MTVPSLTEAIGLRRAPGAEAPDYAAALAIWKRIESRFKKPSDFERLTRGEKLFHELFFALDSEVENGGLHQYLLSSSGDDAERVKTHLREIGATPTLDALEAVSQFFPAGIIPSSRRERQTALSAVEEQSEGFEEVFEDADTAYARAARSLYERLMDYVVAHSAEFLEPRS
jgi:hypothetical protein